MGLVVCIKCNDKIMKKIFYFMSLVCMLMFAACSSDDDLIEDESGEGDAGEALQEVVIGVGMPGSDGTRVDLDDLTLTWEEGDQLTLVGHKTVKVGGQHWWEQHDEEVYKTFDLTLIEGAGTKYAKFRGLVGDYKDFAVYYKTKNLTIDEKTGKASFNYEGAVQNGFNSQEHLKNYLFLYLTEKDKPDKDTPALSKYHFEPLFKKLDELKKGIMLSIRSSILRLDVRTLPNNLKKANEVSWVVNNYSPSNTAAGLSEFFGSLHFKAEIKDIRGKKNEHQYLYIPVGVKDGQFICNEYYSAYEFSDGIVTRSATYKEPEEKTEKKPGGAQSNGKMIFPGKRYNAAVTVHEEGKEDDPHAVSYWDGLHALPVIEGEWPAENQFKIKLKKGVEPLSEVEDANKVVYRLKGIDKEGWCIYETDNGRIEHADGLFIPKYAESVVGIQSPRFLRFLRANLCKDYKNLTEVRLSPYTQTIGAYSFAGCTALEEFTVPYATRTIDNNAFDGFKGTKFVVKAHRRQLSIINEYIFGKGNKVTENCALYIHETWEQYFRVHASNKRGFVYWAGYYFPKDKLVFIDDHGDKVDINL